MPRFEWVSVGEHKTDLRTSRFNEAQMICVMREAELERDCRGVPVARNQRADPLRWKAKHGGIQPYNHVRASA